MSKRNRTTVIVAGAVAVILVGVWYVALWSPQSHRIHAAQQALAASQIQSGHLIGMLSQTRTLEKQVPSDGRELSQSLIAVPVGPGVDAIIGQIAGAASASGVMWPSESLTTGGSSAAGSAPTATTATTAVPSSGGLSSVTMAISISGQYAQLLDFVHRLGQMPRVVSIASLTYSGATGAGPLTLSISGQLFYDPTPLPVAKIVTTVG